MKTLHVGTCAHLGLCASVFLGVAFLAVGSLGVGSLARGQETTDAPIPHTSGQSVSPVYEGWYPNPDGTVSLSFGYFNRNYRERLDIPVGPDNRMEPGPADQGQPTHFLPRRQTGVFTVVVPADFGDGSGDGQVVWTLTAHGETIAIPGHLRPEWQIDALHEVTSGNTPPVLRFEPDATPGRGPRGTRTERDLSFPDPLTITLWATDDGVRKARSASRPPQLGLVWSKYRGPATVTFGDSTPDIDDTGKAVTTATFDGPGEYVLRVLAWDDSGPQGATMAGGFQCCWTNAYVRVSVR